MTCYDDCLRLCCLELKAHGQWLRVRTNQHGNVTIAVPTRRIPYPGARAGG
jgi:hypothetical protein